VAREFAWFLGSGILADSVFVLYLWGEVAEDVELCADGYGQEEGWAGE